MMTSMDVRWDDGRHEGGVEEWVFAAWTADAALGVISGHRLVGGTAWYWAALARAGRPLLHVTDFEVVVRPDPFVVKGEALWAEHHCDAPMEQWSVGNETYASALDDPADALGRAYGTPTPIAFDLEWYATGPPVELDVATVRHEYGGDDANDGSDGYRQSGVVHGVVEVLGEPSIEVEEIPGERWHRWSGGALDLAPLRPEVAVAHTGVRAPFAFPDGSVADLVLTVDGWRRRGR